MYKRCMVGVDITVTGAEDITEGAGGDYVPRRDVIDKTYHSKNERANKDNVPSGALDEAISDTIPGKHISNLADLYLGKQNYSDFTSRFNGYTDGWFSTLANGLPFISNMHNALLGRDSAKDYMENNNLSWEDMQGYNDLKLLGRSSSAINGLANHSSTYLGNIGNDLGKLYSGQKSPSTTPINKQVYSSNYMDAW